MQKLEFTKGDSAPSTPTTGLPISEISNKLHDLIVMKKLDNESVFDWIETNVDEPTTKTHAFIRTLMTAVCNSAIKGRKGNLMGFQSLSTNSRFINVKIEIEQNMPEKLE